MNAKFIESCRKDLHIDESILESAQKEAEQDGSTLIQVLLRQNWWDAKDLMNKWSKAYQIYFISLGMVDIPQKILDLVPYEVVRDFRVIPLEQSGDAIILACAHPEDREAQEKIELALKRKVNLVLADANEIEKAFRRFYKLTLRVISNPSFRIE